MCRLPGNSKGFSLIELALIVGIIGLMAGSALQTYRNYATQKVLLTNQATKKAVSDALARFFYEHKRYPCPGDPSLPPSDPNAGVENCLSSLTGNGCVGGVCRINGARTISGVTSTVLTGTLPSVTMGVTLKSTLDGWGSKLGYAVTETMTQDGNYNDQNGTIGYKVYDKTSGTSTAARNPNVPDSFDPSIGAIGAFELAVVSYGQDQRGAYNYQGKAMKPCTGLGLDIENCNGDSTFMLAPSYFSYVDNAEHFDDAFVISDVQKESDKWQISSTAMSNKTGGKVGVGTSAPSYPLDVNGNILTSEYQSDTYCDQDGNNCFASSQIAGSGMVCDNGLLTGFSNNAADCLRKFDPASVQSASCSTGEYINGFDSNGKPTCGTPP